jgi:hypothetical protein
MPNWKKVIVSGSNAELNQLEVTTSITGSSAQLTSVPTGTSETNILLTDGSGNLVTRTDLSLQGATGAQGTTGTQGTLVRRVQQELKVLQAHKEQLVLKAQTEHKELQEHRVQQVLKV